VCGAGRLSRSQSKNREQPGRGGAPPAGRKSRRLIFKLLKSEIFAIVFRWIGQGEIAAERGVPASVRPEARAVGNFFIPIARNPLKSPDSKK
jgi:hypothetical protein